jgi:hypothetical protein
MLVAPFEQQADIMFTKKRAACSSPSSGAAALGADAARFGKARRLRVDISPGVSRL